MRISDWSSDVCSSDLPCSSATGTKRHRSRCCRDRRSVRSHRRKRGCPRPWRRRCLPQGRGRRSEEHTSELQSLMRTSYAVFCLKKKTVATRNLVVRHLHRTQNKKATHLRLPTQQISQ